jgi:hypothetical protein
MNQRDAVTTTLVARSSADSWKDVLLDGGFQVLSQPGNCNAVAEVFIPSRRNVLGTARVSIEPDCPHTQWGSAIRISGNFVVDSVAHLLLSCGWCFKGTQDCGICLAVFRCTLTNELADVFAAMESHVRSGGDIPHVLAFVNRYADANPRLYARSSALGPAIAIGHTTVSGSYFAVCDDRLNLDQWRNSQCYLELTRNANRLDFQEITPLAMHLDDSMAD